MNEMAPLIYADADALAKAAASALVRLVKAAVTERGSATVALSGGSTPKKLYTVLATDPACADAPWDKVDFFFGDERHVPPDNDDSNFLMVKKSLLSTQVISEKRVHRMRAELPRADAAAAEYEKEMRSFFDAGRCLDGFPRFDLILLGMGPDGHTASLFPDSPALAEEKRWVMANPVEKFKTDRITFTFPVVNAAREIHLLVAGRDKAEMIRQVLDEKQDHPPYPVQRVVPVEGRKVWMLDDAAAAQLDS
jgi:6-phosphogluconolactonase